LVICGERAEFIPYQRFADGASPESWCATSIVANLSLNSAKRIPAPRSREILEAKARSLICGVSWVYQRIHNLDKARVAAQESRKISEMANLDVNLAFCLKCLGRLARMEAEKTRDQSIKESKLYESRGLLEQAIDRFSQIENFGSRHPEVGDCHSLLGRTYLAAGQIGKAETAVRKAYEILKDVGSKDYIDLVILNGDLQAARDNKDDANGYYKEALELSQSSDSQITEMRARAYFKRGKNQILMNPSEAIRDFEEAATIWSRLGEYNSAAEAKWEIICLTENLSYDTLQIFDKEDFDVRVKAVELHQNLIAPYKGKQVAQRARFDRNYWKQRIKEASEHVAAKAEEW
jgi:tetratricopeptide (TPR) repeat protein